MKRTIFQRIIGFLKYILICKLWDAPHVYSFDKDRNGFVISEGAGCLILEDYQHAINRKAPIYAELLSYGLNSDAEHITNPHPDGPAKCMTQALNKAKLQTTDIDVICAHGTSTLLGDRSETKAIKLAFLG